MRLSSLSLLLVTALLVAVAGASTPAPSQAPAVSQELAVDLFPDDHRLVGRSMLTVDAGGDSEFTILLSPSATVDAFTVNGVGQVFSNGRATVAVPSGTTGEPVHIAIRYSAVYNDPAPRLPANTDNPGYGVVGTIQPEGILLLGGSGWYPHVAAATTSMTLTVAAPAGVFAVTAGKPLGTRTENGRSVSVWEVQRPTEPLPLAASRYRIGVRNHGDITVATYFKPDTADLSTAYLDASTRYLDMYEALFGPYGFDQFAVVENFFPTGYGFPSFTLIGGQVLRLPFIIGTSLGHEIAHCWWGNGVLVDYGSGNWSEGLTTYVAEHLYKEKQSREAAIDHRMNTLRNYAALVTEDTDFPLSRFLSRTDAASRTIGYDKGAMVFHMIRKRIGETAFWGGLKDLYLSHRFKPASWGAFQRVFEQRSGEDLNRFFDNWVHRKGAVDIALSEPKRVWSDGRWRVSGAVRQTPPLYSPTVTFRIETAAGATHRQLSLDGEQTPFEFEVTGQPTAILADPDVDLFRKLHPSEIPPSVNRLKGVEGVAIVLASGAEALTPSAEMLIRAMPLKRARIVKEADVDADFLQNHTLILVGQPQTRPLTSISRRLIDSASGSPALAGMPSVDDANAVFGVFDHPYSPGRFAAVFLSTDPANSVTVARKIPHYGRYGYLAFSETSNRAKGVWPVTASPLIARWASDPPSPGQ
jgi:aminopeptidase N